MLMLADGPLRQALIALGARVEVVALPDAVAATGDSRLVGRNAVSDEAKVQASTVSSTWKRIQSCLGLPNSGFRFVRFLWQLKRSIRLIKPDLIHSSGIKSHLCLALIQAPRCPVVWHIHDFFSHRPRVQQLIRLASRRATGCLAISQSVKRDIGIVAPRLPVRLLENCVDTERFVSGSGSPAELDRAGGLSNVFVVPRIRVGLIATYANWKGHDVFLRAIQKCPTVTGYIVGGPIYTTTGSQWTECNLRDQAAALGIADRVGFVGFQSDPVWIYQSLDIVVHASVRPEPFGLTIIEAMSCGRAVVVSNAGGAAELFTDMHDAIGHQLGDCESLANAIQRLAEDPALRIAIGSNARKSVLGRFTTDEFGRKLVDSYQEFAGKMPKANFG